MMPGKISYDKLGLSSFASETLAKFVTIFGGGNAGLGRESELVHAAIQDCQTSRWPLLYELIHLCELEADIIKKAKVIKDAFEELQSEFDGSRSDDEEYSSTEGRRHYAVSDFLIDLGEWNTNGKFASGIDELFEKIQFPDKMDTRDDPQARPDPMEMEMDSDEEDERRRRQRSATPATFPLKSKRGITNIGDEDTDDHFKAPDDSEYLGYFTNNRRRIPIYGFGHPDFYELITPDNVLAPEENREEDLRYSTENGDIEIRLGDPGIHIRRILGLVMIVEPAPSFRTVTYYNVAITKLGKKVKKDKARDTIWTTYSGLIDAFQYEEDLSLDLGYKRKGKIGKKATHKMHVHFVESRSKRMKECRLKDVKIPREYRGEQRNSPSDTLYYLKLKDNKKMMAEYIKEREYMATNHMHFTRSKSKTPKVEPEIRISRGRSKSPSPRTIKSPSRKVEFKDSNSESGDSGAELEADSDEHSKAPSFKPSDLKKMEARIRKSIEASIQVTMKSTLTEMIEAEDGPVMRMIMRAVAAMNEANK